MDRWTDFAKTKSHTACTEFSMVTNMGRELWLGLFCIKGCRHKYRRISKIGQRWNSTLLGWEAWLTPRNTCYHVKFGSYVTVYAKIEGNTKIGECWDPAPLRWGRGWPFKNKPLLHMCYHVKFDPTEFCRSTSNGTSVINEIRLKIWFLASMCNISYRFPDTWRFHPNITKFSHPHVFCAPTEGIPLAIGIWGQKSRIIGLPGRERSLTISSTIWKQYTNVTDGRWTDTRQQERLHLRMALRG